MTVKDTIVTSVELDRLLKDSGAAIDCLEYDQPGPALGILRDLHKRLVQIEGRLS